MTTTASSLTAEKDRQGAFNATLGRVGTAWKRAGKGISLEGLKKAAPAAEKHLEAAQHDLNTIWLSCQNDMAEMRHFTEKLDAWEAANYRAIAAMKAAL